MLKSIDSGLKKALSMTLLFITVMSFTLTSFFNTSKITASAHNSYFVAITFDDSANRLVALVLSEDNDIIANNHLEADVGDFSSNTVGKSWSLPSVPTSDEDKKNEDYYKDYVAKGDGDKGLVFTFPGVHGRGCFGACTEKVDANGEDEQLAYAYAETVVAGLNQAITFLEDDSNTKKTGNDMRNAMVELANAVENGSSSITYGGVTYSITTNVAPKMKTELLKDSDYVQITSGTSGKSVIVPYKMNKGYQGSNPFRKTSSSYVSDLAKYNDPTEIGWKYAVLQANYNKDIKGITFSSVNQISKPNQLEIALSGMINSALGTLRQLLGLYPMEELMLNSGARAQSYYYGIMPNSWKASANLLHVVCLLIAWALLMGAVIKILINKSLSTINVTQKISMMEGIKNLISTCFLLAFFPFLFYLMAKLNASLVDVFANAGSFTSYIGQSQTMSTGLLGTSLIAIAFFIVNVYFNFQYVLRAITVAILYGMAPLAIVSLAFGGKAKMIFGNCIKQLVGNIFTQTFHAMCVAFFTNVTSTTSMRTFELLVVFYSFIPLTKFIKQQIFGLDGGIQDEAGGLVDNVRGVATGVVGGFAGGVMANKMQNSGSGGFSGGGGFSGTRKDSLNKAVNNDSVGGSISEKFGNSNSNSAILGANNNNYHGVSSKTSGNSRSVSSTGKGQLGSIGGSLVKGAIGAGIGLASSGASLGFSAIGDKRGASQMAGIAGGAMAYAGNSATQPLRDGIAMKRAGVKDVYEDNDSLTFRYNAGQDGKFRDEDVDNTTYADNVKDIYNAYAGKGIYEGNTELQELAKEHYARQGINGVGLSGTGDNADIAINVDKQKFSQLRGGVGYKSVGQLQRFDSTRFKLQQERQQQQDAMRDSQHKEKIELSKQQHAERLAQQERFHNDRKAR